MNHSRPLLLSLTVLGLLFVIPALAFLGPGIGQNPGEGGGLLSIDANKNIGLGTQTPAPTYNFDASSTESGGITHGHVFLVASSSNPGLGLRNTSYSSGQGIMYLWSVRDFGALQLYREGGALPGKAVFHITPLGKVGVSTFQIDEGVRLQVGDGDIKAPGFQGSGVNLTDIDPTAFIANSAFPSGNFAFPGALAVGTSTVVGLPSNGLYVGGSVGIGTTSPTTNMEIYGANPRLTISHNAYDAGNAALDFRHRLNPDAANVGTKTAIVSVATGGTYGRSDLRFVLNNVASTAGYDVTNDARMTILSSGNVGIGTTSPIYPLQVKMGGSSTNELSLTTTDWTTSVGSALIFGHGASTGNTYSVINAFTGGYASSGILALNSNGGNVGIGTTLPNARLHILGNGIPITPQAGTQLVVQNNFSTGDISRINVVSGTTGQGILEFGDSADTDEAAIQYNPNEGDLSFRTGNVNDRMVIGINGNVGIGKTNPATALDVNGTITATAFSGPLSGTISAANVSAGEFGANTGGGTYTFPGTVNATSFSGTFGGVSLAKFVYGGVDNGGSAAPVTWASSDFSQYRAAFWDVNGASWTPDTDWWWGMTLPHRSNSVSYNYGAQFVVQNSPSASTYVRTIVNGTPNAWAKVWTSASDGSASGLDADLLDGWNLANASTVSTVVGRDGSGDINARLFRSEYDTTNASVNYIMTQIDTASNNYIRPSTPAQVMTALGAAPLASPTFTGNVTMPGSGIWNSSGNVGIGTTAPGAKLEVAGQVKITGGTPAAGQVLTSDAAGLATWEPVSAGMGGSGTASYIPKFTAATTLGNSLIYDNGTNVGIGTTSPGYTLDVSGNIRATGVVYANANGAKYFQGGDDGALYDVNVANTVGIYGVQDSTQGHIKLGSSGPVISGYGGNVGIGTTGPGVKLDVAGGSIRASNSDNVNVRANSTGADSDAYMSVMNDAREWRINVDGDVSDSLLIYDATADQTRMAINSSGNVGIGTTEPNNLLQVSGLINFNNTIFGTFLGYQAGNSTTGANNSFIGYQAGFSNTTASYNTAVGRSALRTNTTASYNTALGYYALYANSAGVGNVAVGSQTLYVNTSGGYNTALGITALYANSVGTANVAVGNSALYGNSLGIGNTGIGADAFRLNTTGNNNVAVGRDAGYGSGGTPVISNSVLAGYRAGYVLTTGGDNNILLGYRAGDNLTTGNTNIVIGYDIDAPSATSAQTLNIGNLIFGTGINGTGTTLSTGNVGIGTASPSAKLEVKGGKTILEQESWIAPTLGNSWVNYGVAYNAVGYFKDSMGIVHLKGLVRSGNCNTAIFQLPAGYRPESRELHVAITNDEIGRVDISVDGDVVPTNPICDNGYVSLDGITFRAYQ